MKQQKENRKITVLLICNNTLAGDESLNWHPLLADFIIVGQKLEQLGFMYFKSTVIIIDPMEVQ